MNKLNIEKPLHRFILMILYYVSFLTMIFQIDTLMLQKVTVIRVLVMIVTMMILFLIVRIRFKSKQVIYFILILILFLVKMLFMQYTESFHAFIHSTLVSLIWFGLFIVIKFDDSRKVDLILLVSFVCIFEIGDNILLGYNNTSIYLSILFAIILTIQYLLVYIIVKD